MYAQTRFPTYSSMITSELSFYIVQIDILVFNYPYKANSFQEYFYMWHNIIVRISGPSVQ